MLIFCLLIHRNGDSTQIKKKISIDDARELMKSTDVQQTVKRKLELLSRNAEIEARMHRSMPFLILSTLDQVRSICRNHGKKFLKFQQNLFTKIRLFTP